jgi:hypothetical protein
MSLGTSPLTVNRGTGGGVVRMRSLDYHIDRGGGDLRGAAGARWGTRSCLARGRQGAHRIRCEVGEEVLGEPS